MCTATIIPLSHGYRVVMNRDELRSRARALRPTVVDLESGVRAAWPTDGQAGGTWVAAGHHGLVLGLLNGNPTPYPQLAPEDELVSRGLMIPSLIQSACASEAIDRVGRVEVRRYAPFRLVAVDHEVVADAMWDGNRLRVSRRPMRATCFVSSGLGDGQVAPRLGLFRRWIVRHGLTPESQDRFHEHRWADRPEISVMMERAEARTVSVTWIEVARSGGPVEMRYRDDAGTTIVRLDKPVAARERAVEIAASRR